MKAVLFVALLCACGSNKEKEKSNDVEDMKEEASVEFARKQIPELDKMLASDDLGQASSTCAVIKPDMPAIEKADAKLAAEIVRRCNHDLALRSLAVFVARAEAERAKDPEAKFISECSSWNIYMKPVINAKADGEPEVAALKERFSKACPGKP